MLAKVHNLNIHPYTEEFRGNKITIAPGSYVEMDEDEAEYFMQTFTFPKKDSQGRPDPLFFKKLKLEKPPLGKNKDGASDDLVCHANGQRAASAEELSAVLKSFSHMMASKDEAAESDLKKQNAVLKKANLDLKSRLQRIEDKLGFLSSESTAEGEPDAASV